MGYDSDSDDMMMESSFERDFSDSDDDFMQENTKKVTKAVKKAKVPVAKKPVKKAPAKAAKKSSALETNKNADNMIADSDDDGMEFDDVKEAPAAAKKGGSKKTIEQTYQKKTQLEHILLRPDTYIGSTERLTEQMFVYDAGKEKIVQREVTFTPGLYKIFDEIVVNASDNKQRDPTMNEMEIVVDKENNLISVKNNGKGIPIEMHKEHNCYVPTLIFGHLLTGSNFDDNEKKTTGGRNGYGAKLANVFSTEFVIECVDSGRGKKFRQVFRNNMTAKDEPVVKDCSTSEKKKGDYTKISFKPDLERFGMTELDDDAVALMSKRAYDMAGAMAARPGKKLGVTLNGTKVPVKNFKEYLKLFEGINEPVAYEQVGERWEVGVAPSIDGSAQQISFVNAISTSKGGGHVVYIVDQLVKHLQKTTKKKNKGGGEIKPGMIKNQLCVFVNCLVENPAFDSQTKENLSSKPKTFGSECKLSDKFLKAVDKSAVVDNILAYDKFRQNEALKRKGGVKTRKLTGIPKLDDANNAGTAKSAQCTLIITEGDSAKSLAMSGLSIVGRDNYGVFPLKGKPLNVREANNKQITGNDEINNIVKILGLKFNTEYNESNIKTLRYGSLMIMADQDHDGSHIKGLVINFIHHFWPSLLDVPGFLRQFITPIVKATKKKKEITFFNLPEYEAWRKTDESKGYTIKYYKGLGTSTAKEAKEYFSTLDKHEVLFSLLKADNGAESHGDGDDMDEDVVVPDKPVSGTDLIDMAFSKKRVEDRKAWLNACVDDTFLDYSKCHDGVRYSQFINEELVLFSKSDCARSIPHVIDGFKPSQRKVLFACFKRKLKAEIKVAQLAGYIGEHSAYHHGEASLHGTIVNMAQNFVGSNNVNLLTPSGQFGTRRMGGKDSASPRYIFTTLEPVTRAIFHPDDDELLNYLNDDGLSIEPDFYCPVIPLALVNGSDGIGTGWSSTIPNYCPRKIIAALRKMILGEENIERLSPEYYGFEGTITAETATKYVATGRIERTNDTTLVISELPIRKWTQDYKVFLEEMMNGTEKTHSQIKDFKENHTDTTVSFTITADKAKIDEFEKFKDGLVGKFKLTHSLSTNNMHLFDKEGRITKYGTPEKIMETFFEIRSEFYVKRKALLLEKLRIEQRMLKNKARFVEEVCARDLVVSNRKKKDLLADLKERGYETFHKDSKKKADDDGVMEEEEDDSSDADLVKGYEYLLGMKLWSLTREKVEQLRRELEEKTRSLEELEATEPNQIWLNDLDALEVALDQREAALEALQEEEKKAQTKGKKAAAKKSKAAAAKKRGKKTLDWDSEESSDEDHGFSDSDVEVMPKKKATSRSKPAAASKPAATKKKPAVKKAAPVVASKPAAAIDLASDNEEDLGRDLTKKLMVSPPAKKRESTSSSEGRGQKRPSPKNSNAEDDSPAPPAAKAKASKATKKAKTAAPKSKKVTKKSVLDWDSDEDDFGSDLNSDSDSGSEGDIAPPPPRARSGRAKKVTTYTLEDSDSDLSFSM